jgi:hypothetical protein
MGIGRETEVLGENLSLCHFLHHKSHKVWARTRDAAVGRRRLTAWAMARPRIMLLLADSPALPGYIYLSRDQLLPSIYSWLRNHRGLESHTRCLATARLEHTFPGTARVFITFPFITSAINCCPGIYLYRDQLLPWLRNRCLVINNFSLFVSADMSHVPVAWQRPGWNLHISSDISALWVECHISPCLYSSLSCYNQVKEGNETKPFTER